MCWPSTVTVPSVVELSCENSTPLLGAAVAVAEGLSWSPVGVVFGVAAFCAQAALAIMDTAAVASRSFFTVVPRTWLNGRP